MTTNVVVLEMTEAAGVLRRHNASTAHTPSDLPAAVLSSRACKTTAVKVGYRIDTQYLGKLQQKQGQHSALETALKTYGYEVTLLSCTLGFYRSLYPNNKKSVKAVGSSQ